MSLSELDVFYSENTYCTYTLALFGLLLLSTGAFPTCFVGAHIVGNVNGQSEYALEVLNDKRGTALNYNSAWCLLKQTFVGLQRCQRFPFGIYT